MVVMVVWVIHKASVRSLLSLAILLEIERSMVRSPISTTRPPMREGSTLLETLSFWPVLMKRDLEMAVSRRVMSLGSRG